MAQRGELTFRFASQIYRPRYASTTLNLYQHCYVGIKVKIPVVESWISGPCGGKTPKRKVISSSVFLDTTLPSP
jgi:hypothetical protein